jgi:hypothetical protein
MPVSRKPVPRPVPDRPRRFSCYGMYINFLLYYWV